MRKSEKEDTILYLTWENNENTIQFKNVCARTYVNSSPRGNWSCKYFTAIFLLQTAIRQQWLVALAQAHVRYPAELSPNSSEGVEIHMMPLVQCQVRVHCYVSILNL